MEMDDVEFEEADVLWPDSPRDEVLFRRLSLTPSEEPYEAASVVSRNAAALAFRRRFEGSSFFLAGARSSSAAASPDTADEEEEWQEAEVLWPDTADGGGASPWSSFRGSAFGWAGRHVYVNPSAPRREGWEPDLSSPIDIPADVAARRRVGARRCL